MAIERFRWVAAVIASHPKCKLVGRTRLQKEIKLLQRIGMPSNYGYRMHFYGPYSDDLQSDIQLLKMFDFVEEDVELSQEGNPYSIFQGKEEFKLSEVEKYQEAINQMAEADSTVLELAATYDAFLNDLKMDEEKALRSLRAKKAGKCEGGNEEAAMELLGSLGVS